MTTQRKGEEDEWWQAWQSFASLITTLIQVTQEPLNSTGLVEKKTLLVTFKEHLGEKGQELLRLLSESTPAPAAATKPASGGGTVEIFVGGKKRRVHFTGEEATFAQEFQSLVGVNQEDSYLWIWQAKQVQERYDNRSLLIAAVLEYHAARLLKWQCAHLMLELWVATTTARSMQGFQGHQGYQGYQGYQEEHKWRKDLRDSLEALFSTSSAQQAKSTWSYKLISSLTSDKVITTTDKTVAQEEAKAYHLEKLTQEQELKALVVVWLAQTPNNFSIEELLLILKYLSSASLLPHLTRSILCAACMAVEKRLAFAFSSNKGVVEERAWIDQVGKFISSEKWKSQAMKHYFLLHWSFFLLGLVEAQPALARELSIREDNTERISREALENHALDFARQYLLGFQCPLASLTGWRDLDGLVEPSIVKASLEELAKSPFRANWKHVIITMVDYLVHTTIRRNADLLRRFKAREEDISGGGVVSALFDLIAALYRYPHQGMLGEAEQQRMEFWRQGRLQGFLDWAASSQAAVLVTSCLDMLASLARGEEASKLAFDFINRSPIQQGGRFSSVINWRHLFFSLNQYAASLRPHIREDLRVVVRPEETRGLTAFLKLLEQVITYSPEARLNLYENPQDRAVLVLFELLSCPVDPEFKAALLNTLSAFALPLPSNSMLGRSDIALHLWMLLEQYQLLPAKGGGVLYELEQVEAPAETFPLTRAFVRFLTSLIHLPSYFSTNSLHASSKGWWWGVQMTCASIPAQLGQTAVSNRARGVRPFIQFVLEQVFLSASTRSYCDPREKWSVQLCCLELFERCLMVLLPPITSKDEESVGAFLLERILNGSRFLPEIIGVLRTSDDLLKTSSNNISEDLSKCKSVAFRILSRVMAVQEKYFVFGFTNKSVPLERLEHWLFVKPQWIPDLTLNIKGNSSIWCVRFLRQLSASPGITSATKINRLATVLESSREWRRILFGFIERLEFAISNSTEEDEGGVYDPAEGEEGEELEGEKLSGEIINLILDNVQDHTRATPTIAHLLLGFSLQTSLSDTRISGVISCSKALFEAAFSTSLTNGNEMTRLRETACHVWSALLTSPYTVGPVMRYLGESGSGGGGGEEMLLIRVIKERLTYPGTIGMSVTELYFQAWLMHQCAVWMHASWMEGNQRQVNYWTRTLLTSGILLKLFQQAPSASVSTSANNIDFGSVDQTQFFSIDDRGCCLVDLVKISYLFSDQFQDKMGKRELLKNALMENRSRLNAHSQFKFLESWSRLLEMTLFLSSESSKKPTTTPNSDELQQPNEIQSQAQKDDVLLSLWQAIMSRFSFRDNGVGDSSFGSTGGSDLIGIQHTWYLSAKAQQVLSESLLFVASEISAGGISSSQLTRRSQLQNCIAVDSASTSHGLTVRGNLYISLLLSTNLDQIASTPERAMERICRDGLEAPFLWRTVALVTLSAVLDTMSQNTIMSWSMVKHLVYSLRQLLAQHFSVNVPSSLPPPQEQRQEVIKAIMLLLERYSSLSVEAARNLALDMDLLEIMTEYSSHCLEMESSWWWFWWMMIRILKNCLCWVGPELAPKSTALLLAQRPYWIELIKSLPPPAESLQEQTPGSADLLLNQRQLCDWVGCHLLLASSSSAGKSAVTSQSMIPEILSLFMKLEVSPEQVNCFKRILSFFNVVCDFGVDLSSFEPALIGTQSRPSTSTFALVVRCLRLHLRLLSNEAIASKVSLKESILDVIERSLLLIWRLLNMTNPEATLSGGPLTLSTFNASPFASAPFSPSKSPSEAQRLKQEAAFTLDQIMPQLEQLPSMNLVWTIPDDADRVKREMIRILTRRLHFYLLEKPASPALPPTNSARFGSPFMFA